jgi:hypothetical protein
MTEILHRPGTPGEPHPEAAGLVVSPLANGLSAGRHPPEGTDQEEVLVADVRFGLTPSQMVDHKLAALLGAGHLACARAALGRYVRQMAGSREGAAPTPHADVSAADATFEG